MNNETKCLIIVDELEQLIADYYEGNNTFEINDLTVKALKEALESAKNNNLVEAIAVLSGIIKYFEMYSMTDQLYNWIEGVVCGEYQYISAC